MGKNFAIRKKPVLPKHLFWEFRYDQIDRKEDYLTVATSTGITIAIVKPTYVGKNPEYFVPPFNEMAVNMGNDFEEMLTDKCFTVRDPFWSRNERVYNDEVNSSSVLEIGIDINPQYNRKYSPAT